MRRHALVGGQERPGAVETGIKGVSLTILCLLVVIPFVGILSTSVSSASHINRSGGFVLLPDGIHLEAYRSLLSGGVVTRALLVSLGITVIGSLLSLIVTTAMAYGLSRSGSLLSRPVLLLVLFSLLFTPGLIPSYLTVKTVGLMGSWWALILPSLVSAFNVIVLRSFFMGLPTELIESARIDGANDFDILMRVVLPLSKAILAVIGLFYAVGYWNSFFNALLYLSDQAKWPLPLVLRTYVLDNAQLAGGDIGAVDVLPPQPALQMAMLVIAITPILVVYPFLQRHFATGMLTGAVKG